MDNIVGPELLQSVKTISSIIVLHHLVNQQKSIGLVKTGFGSVTGESRAVMAMTDALTDKMIDFRRMKDASKIWITSSSSQSLSYDEMEDMKLIFESTIGMRDSVLWEHTIDIDLYDNFQVSVVGGGNERN